MAYNNSGKCKTMFGNINNLVLNHNTTNILTENYINARIDESFNQGNMNSKYIDMNDMVSNIGSLDSSFVEEGYKFLMDYNHEYYTSLREFYSNIALSEGDEGIINESFSGVWETIKKLIRKFIEFLKRCFKKLSEKLHAIFKSEKYITKHKDLIYKFNSDDDFQFDGYNFTINPDIPFAKAIPEMGDKIDSSFDNSARDAATGLYNDNWDDNSNDEYTKDLGFVAATNAFKQSVKTASHFSDEKAFTELCKKYHEKIINGNDAYFDRIRAAVIGEKNGNISQEDFSKELKMKFRDGDESTTTIEADSNYVQQCYINFSNYKDTLKEAEKTKNNLEKEYTHLEKWVDSVAKATSSSNLPTDPSDSMAAKITEPVGLVVKSAPNGGINLSKNSAFNTLMHDISSNIQRLSNIHTQAYTAKIEAIKDQFAQDKRVLYKAIAQVLKHHKKGE